MEGTARRVFLQFGMMFGPVARRVTFFFLYATPAVGSPSMIDWAAAGGRVCVCTAHGCVWEPCSRFPNLVATENLGAGISSFAHNGTRRLFEFNVFFPKTTRTTQGVYNACDTPRVYPIPGSLGFDYTILDLYNLVLSGSIIQFSNCIIENCINVV